MNGRTTTAYFLQVMLLLWAVSGVVWLCGQTTLAKWIFLLGAALFFGHYFCMKWYRFIHRVRK
jgi:hypothetical protein